MSTSYKSCFTSKIQFDIEEEAAGYFQVVDWEVLIGVEYFECNSFIFYRLWDGLVLNVVDVL